MSAGERGVRGERGGEREGRGGEGEREGRGERGEGETY